MKYTLIALFAFCSLCASAQPGGGRAAAPQHKNTFLNASFWQGNPDVNAIKAEIAKGHSPVEMNGNSFDPVVMAINANAPAESIIYLIEQGGNEVNKLTHDSRTYIFWSASRGNTEVMKYVLDKGAKTDLIDSHGASPLTFAAGGGQQNTAVYDLLIAKGVDLKKDVNHDGANALLLMIGNDDELKLTQYFISKGLSLKDTDAHGATAFDYAARAGNMEVMKKLLEKGVKPTGNAMVMAAMGTRRGANKPEVFTYLESLGVSPAAVNKEGNNALHYLVRRPGQEEAIQYFLGKGAQVNQVNEEGNTVFMNAAASNNDAKTMDLLFPSVKNINLANKKGATALTLAVKGNSPEIVQYLINKGADVHTTDANGNNLAYYLVESYNARQAENFQKKLDMLQAKGFKFGKPQKDGTTLYHLAIAKEDLELLKKVAAFGVDVNAKNKDGVTALHKAAMVSKNDAMLRYLLSIGASKNVKTEFDETAYDLASENGFLSKENISVDFLK